MADQNSGIATAPKEVDAIAVANWISLAEKLAIVKAAEMEARLLIANKILDGKLKGAKSGKIGKYTLTATGAVNTKVDAEGLKQSWKELSPYEKSCIRFKAEVAAKNYNADGDTSTLDQFVTTKPGTPSLKLKKVN